MLRKMMLIGNSMVRSLQYVRAIERIGWIPIRNISKRFYSRKSDFENYDNDDNIESLITFSKEHEEFFHRDYLLPIGGHQVFVIQPEIKWGPSKNTLTTADLQLSESCALIESLPKWKVVDRAIYTLKHPNKKTLYGKGTMDTLTRKIRGSCNISAVFVSTDILSALQLASLQDRWGLPVYDRYTIVLQIFKTRARTKEAKIQVALAEIPYLRSRLRGMHQGSLDQQRGGLASIGGSGETYLETRQRLLQEKEMKLKRILQTIKTKREMTRRNRAKQELPIIAIVGYTNAGKTSLIKALTGESDLAPRDLLFATLDVTAHAGLLPNHLKVLYIDTVGFISNIPTALIEAFLVTMEDVLNSNVIVHVRDISHPDHIAQKQNVLQTLTELNLPSELSENIIEVCNKIDLVKGQLDEEDKNSLHISATNGFGLQELREAIEQKVMGATGRIHKRIRIPQAGQHLSWLYKEATVEGTYSCEEDTEALLVDAVFTQSAWAKFNATFKKRKKITQR